MVTTGVAEEKPIPHGRVTFHPFVVRREGDVYLLGNERLRRFFEVGPEAVRAIELLQAGHPWETVGGILRKETGRELDIDAFLRRLAPHGFLHTVGPLVVWDAGAAPQLQTPAHPAWRLMRSPLLLAPLAGIAAAGLYFTSSNPDYLARPGEIFLGRDPLLSILGFTALAWILTLGHEAAHYGVARSYGVSAHIRLSTRLHLLVCETDVTNTWRLPKRARALVLAAGMVFNLVVLGMCAAALHAFQPDGLARATLRALILLNVLQILFQGFVFLKNDGYYLMVALGRERNLRGRAFRALEATFRGGDPCPRCGGHGPKTGARAQCPLCGPGRPATRTDRRWLATYAALVVVFSVALLSFGMAGIAYGTVPFMQNLGSLVAESQRTGDWRQGGEAVAVLLLLAVQFGLLIGLSLRRLWRWRRERAAAA